MYPVYIHCDNLHLVGTQHCSFDIISYNPYDNLAERVLLSPFYRGVHQVRERLTSNLFDLPQVSNPGNPASMLSCFPYRGRGYLQVASCIINSCKVSMYKLSNYHSYPINPWLLIWLSVLLLRSRLMNFSINDYTSGKQRS